VDGFGKEDVFIAESSPSSNQELKHDGGRFPYRLGEVGSGWLRLACHGLYDRLEICV
jgi:hypothetical protein